MSIPRSHHFVPICHLRHFTSDGTKYGKLWVGDLLSGRTFPSKPGNVARIKDYYRTEHSAQGEFSYELFLSKLENVYAPTLKRVVDNVAFPPDEELSDLITYFAHLRAFTPARRKKLQALFAQVRGEEQLADPEDWRNYKTIVESSEHPNETDTLIKSVARWGSDGEILALGEVSSDIADQFHYRNWAVLHTRDETFLTGDMAVLALKREGAKHPVPLDVTNKNLEVVVTISPNLAFYGSHSNHGKILEIKNDFVARINRNIVFQADRFIYSKSGDSRILSSPRGSISEAISFIPSIRAKLRAKHN